MLNTLYFKQEFRTIKPGTFFHFYDGVNLLVGDQGCGKSSVLQIICALGGVQKAFWKHRPTNPRDIALLIGDNTQMRVFAHDFENDSARTAPSFDTMGMINMGASISMLTMSHGESSLAIGKLLSELKDHLIILDEPDTGLSPRSALVLADSFKRAAKQGCQIIAAVHNPWLIEEFDTVFSVEHGRPMPSKEFLENMRKTVPTV